jgi:hypothetical protein
LRLEVPIMKEKTTADTALGLAVPALFVEYVVSFS